MAGAQRIQLGGTLGTAWARDRLERSDTLDESCALGRERLPLASHRRLDRCGLVGRQTLADARPRELAAKLRDLRFVMQETLVYHLAPELDAGQLLARQQGLQLAELRGRASHLGVRSIAVRLRGLARLAQSAVGLTLRLQQPPELIVEAAPRRLQRLAPGDQCVEKVLQRIDIGDPIGRIAEPYGARIDATRLRTRSAEQRCVVALLATRLKQLEQLRGGTAPLLRQRCRVRQPLEPPELRAGAGERGCDRVSGRAPGWFGGRGGYGL